MTKTNDPLTPEQAALEIASRFGQYGKLLQLSEIVVIIRRCQPQWISVEEKEKLPLIGVEVLYAFCFCDEWRITTNILTKNRLWDGINQIGAFWQSLPAPPQPAYCPTCGNCKFEGHAKGCPSPEVFTDEAAPPQPGKEPR